MMKEAVIVAAIIAAAVTCLAAIARVIYEDMMAQDLPRAPWAKKDYGCGGVVGTRTPTE